MPFQITKNSRLFTSYFPLAKPFPETLGSTGKHRSSWAEVFYKRSCSENGLENSQEITCA